MTVPANLNMSATLDHAIRTADCGAPPEKQARAIMNAK
jgi:hypothetical protein